MRNERFYRGYRDRAGQPHSCIITPLLSDGLLYTVTVHRREAAGAGRERPCIVASSTKERLRKLLSSSVCAAALLVASIKTVGVCLCPISDRASVCVCVFMYTRRIYLPRSPTQFLSLRSDDSVRASWIRCNFKFIRFECLPILFSFLLLFIVPSKLFISIFDYSWLRNDELESYGSAVIRMLANFYRDY